MPDASSNNNGDPFESLFVAPTGEHPGSIYFSTTTNAAAEPLTAEMVREAMVKMREYAEDRDRERAERLAAFEESVPEQMRGERIVNVMRGLIETDFILHPVQAKRLRDEYDARLREVAGQS